MHKITDKNGKEHLYTDEQAAEWKATLLKSIDDLIAFVENDMPLPWYQRWWRKLFPK